MMGRYKSRKFIAAIVIIVLASIFLAMGRLEGPEWIAAVNISLGLYIGGNVSQKLKGGN
jgi:hypothetical protein